MKGNLMDVEVLMKVLTIVKYNVIITDYKGNEDIPPHMHIKTDDLVCLYREAPMNLYQQMI